MVPNHCWYQGHRYECGLSLSCVFAGSKPLDLCNGGMVWSCCVPRARTGGLEEDFSDPGAEYGIVNDPRKFLFFIYLFFGSSFYHLLLYLSDKIFTTIHILL